MDISIYHKIVEIERNNWWYKARRDIISSLLCHFGLDGNPAHKKILSVGCGVGGELIFLKKYGDVTGVDIDETAIAYCRKAGLGNTVQCADAENLPFPNASFDTVFALDVIEHVRHDELAIQEMHRVLKPGGTIVVTVPAFQCLWTRSDERAHHFRRYTKARLRSLLKPHFLLLKTSYYNTILFLPIAIIKVATRIYEPRSAVGKEVGMPHPFVNSCMYQLFRLEATLLRYLYLPLGISVLAVLVKKEICINQ